MPNRSMNNLAESTRAIWSATVNITLGGKLLVAAIGEFAHMYER
ncbi:hypothetical protein [Salinibius halmophilus]|nr:hypothetical protein [Salinibius halmophilus]